MDQTIPPKNQLYAPIPTDQLPQRLVDKYEANASKHWETFYKRNATKFFKDRHYLDKEFPELTAGPCSLLEVGCGVGNTVFPLLALNPELRAFACDFSPTAVSLVQQHAEYASGRITAFVADITSDDLTAHIAPASIDFCTMVFVLSAITPERMAQAVRNVSRVLRPGSGRLLLRDYAEGDLAQERLEAGAMKRLGPGFFLRGDGTRCYYFKQDELAQLLAPLGFRQDSSLVQERQISNRKRQITMQRRWIQATFTLMATPASQPAEASTTCCHAAPGGGPTNPPPAQQSTSACCGAAPETGCSERGCSAQGDGSSRATGWDGWGAGGAMPGSGGGGLGSPGGPAIGAGWLAGAAGRLAAQRGVVPGMRSGRSLLPESLDPADHELGSICSPGGATSVAGLEAELERDFFAAVGQDSEEAVAAEIAAAARRQPPLQLWDLREIQSCMQHGQLPSSSEASQEPSPTTQPSSSQITLAQHVELDGVTFVCRRLGAEAGSQPEASTSSVWSGCQAMAAWLAHSRALLLGRSVLVLEPPGGCALCTLAALRCARRVHAVAWGAGGVGPLVDDLAANSCRVVIERVRCRTLDSGAAEQLRKLLRELPGGFDVIALPGAGAVPQRELWEAVRHLLSRGSHARVCCLHGTAPDLPQAHGLKPEPVTSSSRDGMVQVLTWAEPSTALE